MEILAVTLMFASMVSLLLIASMKFNSFLKKYYFLVEASAKAAAILFAFGLVVWVVGSYFRFEKSYVEMIAVAPILGLLVSVVIFYILFVPAYIWNDLKQKMNRLLRR